MAKIRNFDSFESAFPHLCPDKREFWHGGADLQSAPPCQISRLLGQCVAPAGRKSHFWITELMQHRHGCALNAQACR